MNNYCRAYDGDVCCIFSYCLYSLIRCVSHTIYRQINIHMANGLDNVLCVGMNRHNHSVFSILKQLHSKVGIHFTHTPLLFTVHFIKIKSSIMSKKGQFRQIVMDQFSDDQVWQSFRPIYLYVKLFGYWPSTYKVNYFFLCCFSYVI